MKMRANYLSVMLILFFLQTTNVNANIFQWIGLKISSHIFGSIWRHIKLAMPYPDVETLFGPIEKKREEVRDELTKKAQAILALAYENNGLLSAANDTIGTVKKTFNDKYAQVQSKISFIQTANQTLKTKIANEFEALDSEIKKELANSQTHFQLWSKKMRVAQNLYNKATTNRKNLFQAHFDSNKRAFEERLKKMNLSIDEQLGNISDQVEGMKNDIGHVEESCQQIQPELDLLHEKINQIQQSNKDKITIKNQFIDSLVGQIDSLSEESNRMLVKLERIVYAKPTAKEQSQSISAMINHAKRLSRKSSSNQLIGSMEPQ